MDQALEDRGSALTAAPVGCAFLDLAQRLRLGAERAAEPALAMWLTARAIDEMNVWRGDHERAVDEILAKGSSLRPAADALLRQTRTSWWFEPLHRGSQLLVARGPNGMDPPHPLAGEGPPTAVERYEQRPAWALASSTVVDGYSSVQQNGGDSIAVFRAPVSCYRATVSREARIFEVHSARDWRELCLRYPAPELGGLRADCVVPDFRLVQRDWDGVHLGLGGLMAAEQVRIDGPGGGTELWGWDAEQTVWLRWVFDDWARVPVVPTLPAPPLPIWPTPA